MLLDSSVGKMFVHITMKNCVQNPLHICENLGMVACVIMPELEVGAENDPWKLLAGQFSLFDELQVQLETPSKPMVESN